MAFSWLRTFAQTGVDALSGTTSTAGLTTLPGGAVTKGDDSYVAAYDARRDASTDVVWRLGEAGDLVGAASQNFYSGMYRTSLQQSLGEDYNVSEVYQLAQQGGFDVGEQEFGNWMERYLGGTEQADVRSTEYELAQYLSQQYQPGEPFGGNLGPVGDALEDIGESGIENVVDPVGTTVTEGVQDVVEDVVDAGTQIQEEVVDPVARAIQDLTTSLQDLFTLPDIPEVPEIADDSGTGIGGRQGLNMGQIRLPQSNQANQGYLSRRHATGSGQAPVRRRTLLGGS